MIDPVVRDNIVRVGFFLTSAIIVLVWVSRRLIKYNNDREWASKPIPRKEKK